MKHTKKHTKIWNAGQQKWKDAVGYAGYTNVDENGYCKCPDCLRQKKIEKEKEEKKEKEKLKIPDEMFEL